MLDDKNSYKNRNLSDVFKELQAMQHGGSSEHVNGQASRQENKVNNINETLNYFSSNSQKTRTTNKTNDLKLSHIITGCSILVVAMALFFPRDTSFKTSYAKVDTEESLSEYELNRHRLNIQNIISENSDMDRVKEQAIEERDVEYETTYTDAPTLPKGEEVTTQEGVLGKDKVTVVKTYENGEFVEEIILAKENILEPTPKLINLGTSEFLARHKVHIGDTMYLVSADNLKESTDANSKDVAEVKQSIDVTLLDLPSEEWCKVSFDGVEGYIKTSNLTSSYTTPNIVEKNRIQRILLKVNINMELNKTSGLTLADYKKIFTGLSNDTNKIFENNYQVFYNMEKKYNINGIFLASMAIHESAWGTSQIAKDKNNLFGYGSYDSTPYESSYEFTNYAEGIETVAKSLVKYYLNPSGTKIYDGETAAGWYYNGPTLSGVNTRYATDPDWHTKVFNYMQMLYNRL
ncbi:MAG: glucosaminidase domain-containing protein [Clostridia bacterium]